MKITEPSWAPSFFIARQPILTAGELKMDCDKLPALFSHAVNSVALLEEAL